MNIKRILPLVLTMVFVVCFMFAFPTVVSAASASPDVGGAISGFFGGILDCLVMIIEGLIGLVAILIQFIVDLVMMIVGLFT